MEYVLALGCAGIAADELESDGLALVAILSFFGCVFGFGWSVMTALPDAHRHETKTTTDAHKELA